VISEERLSKALTYLAETDELAAELKANVSRQEFLAKRIRAKQFLLNEGSVELRKAKAETSNEVGDSDTLMVDAIVAYEKVRARRETQSLIVDVWRTLQANRRVGNI
jgi:hypothetical protein